MYLGWSGHKWTASTHHYLHLWLSCVCKHVQLNTCVQTHYTFIIFLPSNHIYQCSSRFQIRQSPWNACFPVSSLSGTHQDIQFLTLWCYAVKCVPVVSVKVDWIHLDGCLHLLLFSTVYLWSDRMRCIISFQEALRFHSTSKNTQQ